MTPQVTDLVGSVSKFVNYWWAWLVPVVIMYILRKWIGNLWIRLRMKMSEAPCTSPGHIVQFSEGGTKWKIFNVYSSHIYFEATEKKNGDLDVLRKSLQDYWYSPIIYRKV